MLKLMKAARRDITRYPFCKSIRDIEKYSGSVVRLLGTYRSANVSKGRQQCWIAEVVLQDSTAVVIRYEPTSEEVEQFNNRTVIAVGRVLQSYPDECRQWLVAPHLVEIESIEEYASQI